MLDKPDTEVVREWLLNALATSKDPKGKRAALATHCGVSSQAVSGWLKTGRITKTNLEQAAQFFGHGPSFTMPGLAVREQGTTGSGQAQLTAMERELLTAFQKLPKRRQAALLDHVHREVQLHLEDTRELQMRQRAEPTARPHATPPVVGEKRIHQLPPYVDTRGSRLVKTAEQKARSRGHMTKDKNKK